MTNFNEITSPISWQNANILFMQKIEGITNFNFGFLIEAHTITMWHNWSSREVIYARFASFLPNFVTDVKWNRWKNASDPLMPSFLARLPSSFPYMLLWSISQVGWNTCQQPIKFFFSLILAPTILVSIYFVNVSNVYLLVKRRMAILKVSMLNPTRLHHFFA